LVAVVLVFIMLTAQAGQDHHLMAQVQRAAVAEVLLTPHQMLARLAGQVAAVLPLQLSVIQAVQVFQVKATMVAMVLLHKWAAAVVAHQAQVQMVQVARLAARVVQQLVLIQRGQVLHQLG
jgi:hypothetical protein